MRNFIRKNILIISIAALAFFLSFFWLLLRGRPQEKIPPAPEGLPRISPPKSSFLAPGENIKITSSLSPLLDSQFPQTLPVFRIKRFAKGEAEKFIAPVASGLGFSGKFEEKVRPDGVFLVWKEGESFLSVNSGTGRFSFFGKRNITQSLGPTTVLQEVRRVLVSWNLLTAQTQGSVLGFVTADQELLPARSLATADTFIVRFTPTLSGFNVSGVGTTDPPLEAKITKSGDLLSLIYNLSQVGDGVGDYPAQKVSQAQNIVSQGEATILSVLDQKGEPFYPVGEDRLDSVSITSVSISFLETPEDQEFLSPVFIFSGKGKTKSKIDVLVSFVVPAIL